MRRDVSDYLELVECLYYDTMPPSTAGVSALRDLMTIRSRVENEGISFLTITLPQFCADFERSLAQGYVDPNAFRNFAKRKHIPAFLQGRVGRIFNIETGVIYDEISLPDSSTVTSLVAGIRQVCLAFKKIEIACTPEREQAALESFIKTEQSFSSFSLLDEDREKFIHVSRVLWDNLIHSLCLDEMDPRHGPGATAERISGNRKYSWRYWTERLEPYFPVLDNAYVISAFQSQELDNVTLLSPDQELPVRVTLVPKTLKGPRIIAIEPCCMQYTQQGIRGKLYSAIESYWLTRGQINFTDQEINQSLALKSSRDGQLATIDLSDASDRVPLELVSVMFDSNPDLWGAIRACRSEYAELPDGTIVGPLQKFASMGSALCFPIEAMYFYTICVVALLENAQLPVTFANVYHVSRNVYVYGDDIVVPTDAAVTVLETLVKYNCKVNTRKTFVSGKFRESCGVDAYDGVMVTPVYFTRILPRNRRQASEIISWVSTGNQLSQAGCFRTAELAFKHCESIIGKLPYVPEDFPGLGRTSTYGYVKPRVRWNQKFHRPEVKAWVPSPVRYTDVLDGYSALTKSLKVVGIKDDYGLVVQTPANSIDGSDPTRRRPFGHLELSELHGEVAIHRRWVPLY